MIYIGIDNGLTGGLCAISEKHGLIISMIPMPIKKGPKYREIDCGKIIEWISENSLTPCKALIETPTNAKTKTTAASMAGSFHSIRTCMELTGINYIRVTPQAWQKAVLGKLEAGETKSEALSKAKERWPDESWIAKGCRTYHTGLIDAALIAEYGRIKNL